MTQQEMEARIEKLERQVLLLHALIMMQDFESLEEEETWTGNSLYVKAIQRIADLHEIHRELELL